MYAWQLMHFEEWLYTLRIDNLRKKIKTKEKILECADDIMYSFMDRENAYIESIFRSSIGMMAEFLFKIMSIII